MKRAIVIPLAIMVAFVAIVAAAQGPATASSGSPSVELVAAHNSRTEQCAIEIQAALERWGCQLQVGMIYLWDGSQRPIIRVVENPCVVYPPDAEH